MQPQSKGRPLDDRNLTDADVAAIVTELKTQLVTDFYGEIGKGVWALIKKWLLPALLILAVYGIAQDKAFFQSLAANR
jgi:hypothetical protein